MAEGEDSGALTTWLESREHWGLGRYKPRLWLYPCMQNQPFGTFRYVGSDNAVIYRGQPIKHVIFMQTGMDAGHAFAENFATVVGIPSVFLTGTPAP
jgi:hypothetical protein